MPKIPRRFAGLLTGFGMSLIMSFCMSGALTLLNLGVSRQTIVLWLTHNFPLAFLLALPIALLTLPVVRRAVERLTV